MAPCFRFKACDVCPRCGKCPGVIFGLQGFGVRLKGHEVRCARRLQNKSPEIPGFEVCDKLGAGHYGNVWKYKKNCTGETFAVKFLEKSDYVRREGAAAEFPRREREALSLSGRHPNVAYLECAFETDAYWVLVTELCGLGTLTKHIKRDRGGLDAKEARVVGAQILEGLNHLHKMCILHRDIKPDNVGMSGTKEAPMAKLIDFGFAKRAEASNTIVGSYGYCAPEIDKAIKKFGALGRDNDVHDGRCDIYSYGVLLFVIFASCEAKTPTSSLWSHQQFRAMLTNADHPMWNCALYIRKGIEAGVILKRMQDSLALNAIIAMTETNPNLRTASTCAALQLQFFIDASQSTATGNESIMSYQ